MKSFKPYTPSRRFITVEDFSGLSKTGPLKSLVTGKRKSAGRNNSGMIMVRHQGGGHKQAYRQIDFRRDKTGVPGKVVSIEYDPNRSARIALINYADGDKRYILQPEGLKIGDSVVAGPEADIKVGNALPLHRIPEGTMVHNLELMPGRGGKMVRSAGAAAQVMAKEGDYVQLRMPSGEIRQVERECLATVGQVGNLNHENVVLGNAGRSRHLGIRPDVRGTAMNAVDHPHGGGRGRSKGNNQPRSPWNQPAKGYKTRSKKIWDWMILKHRSKQAVTTL
ncbi:MAG: 50S ribosomal protein L2 [Elusimicrobia bacterium RIFCSPLOWO2_01_FULL_59_12]|nr:MAG: 50S ribosomal protein L2 [Elusimicrobia bacterium RIFCSPLOWO2_01_FULL_59_12]